MRHIALAAVAWLTVGCISPHQSTAVDVDPDGWDQPVVLLLPNADTMTRCDMTLFLRCNSRFQEDTLTVRLELGTPDGLRHTERVLLSIIRDARPAALLHEFAIPYRHRVRFLRRGNYRLTITPMRNVMGVEAAGINITNSK